MSSNQKKKKKKDEIDPKVLMMMGLMKLSKLPERTKQSRIYLAMPEISVQRN